MNQEDVKAALRLEGIEDLAMVKRASVESDGEVSVILEEWAEPLRRGDLDEEGRLQPMRRTSGNGRS